MNQSSDLQTKNDLKLKHGFRFTDLFETSKLKELTDLFYGYYKTESPEEYAKFSAYRDAKGLGYDEVETSKILISSARLLEKFTGELFGIENELLKLKQAVDYERIVLNVKKDFFQKRVFKKFKKTDADNLNYNELNKKVNVLKKVLFSELEWKADEERSTSVMINEFLEPEKDYKTFLAAKTPVELPEAAKNKINDFKKKLQNSGDAKFVFEGISIEPGDEAHFNYEMIKNIIDVLEKWCFMRAHDKNACKEIKNWILYKIPLDLNYLDLVHNKVTDKQVPEKMYGSEESLRRRDGFKLTDERYNEREVMSEVEYCVFCHERKKDSCSKGCHEKDGAVEERIRSVLSLTAARLTKKFPKCIILRTKVIRLVRYR